MNISLNTTNALLDICKSKDGQFIQECIYKNFCPQFNQYFIKTSIILIFLNIAIPFCMKMYFKHWYKFKGLEFLNKFFGNQSIEINRFYVYEWVTSWVRVMDCIFMLIILIYSLGGIRF